MNTRKPYKRLLKPLKLVPQYKDFNVIISSIHWEGVPHIISEAESSFSSRKIRLLNSNSTLKKIDKVITHDIGIRSRLVVLRASVNNTHSVLHDSLETLREQLYYDNPLDYKFKTQTELKFRYKENLIYWVDYRNMLESWVDNIDSFIEDIDKSTWAIKNMLHIRDMEIHKEWGVDK